MGRRRAATKAMYLASWVCRWVMVAKPFSEVSERAPPATTIQPVGTVTLRAEVA